MPYKRIASPGRRYAGPPSRQDAPTLETAMKIYTKTGDAGDTGLFGGGRVPKSHPRVEAYGDVDELNATIGVVRATGTEAEIDALLVRVQRDLFAIGALLATPDREKMRAHLKKAKLDAARVLEL